MTEILFQLVLFTKKYALRIIIPQYMYPFLSCYIFALFQILGHCPPKIIDASLPITTKILECVVQTSFFKSMSSSSQYLFKSKILSQASFLRNVFFCPCICRTSVITIIFFKACVHYFSFFSLNDRP